MGKKATSLLLNLIISVSTILFAVLALLGWLAGHIPPSSAGIMIWFNLAITPILVVNLFFLIYWSIKLNIKMIIIPLVAILFNIVFITSILRIDLYNEDTSSTNKIRVATYNIKGHYQKNLKNAIKDISNFLKREGVEIVCFQEFKHRDYYPLDSIAMALDFLPYHSAPMKDGDRPIAIFSKYPITNFAAIPFENEYNSAMWADLDIDGKTVRIFNLHLQTTNMSQSQNEINTLRSNITDHQSKESLSVIMERLSDNYKKRASQVELIRKVMDSTTTALIVCGDFNDSPASYTYKQIGKGLNESFREAGSGYNYTFRGIYKLFKLDYILYSKDFEAVYYDSPYLEISDHKPVVSDLNLL